MNQTETPKVSRNIIPNSSTLDGLNQNIGGSRSSVTSHKFQPLTAETQNRQLEYKQQESIISSLGKPLQFHHQTMQSSGAQSFSNSRNQAGLLVTNNTGDESNNKHMVQFGHNLKVQYDNNNGSAQDYNYPQLYKQQNLHGANAVNEFKLGNLSNYSVKASGDHSSQQKSQFTRCTENEKIPLKQLTLLPSIATSAIINDPQNRKMSLAAKSGQMQIFSNFNQQNNDAIQLNYNYNVTMPAGAAYSHNQSAQKIEDGIRINPNPQMNQFCSQLSQQSTTNQQQMRQFDSYMGRRQIIQQQREKKQELLKQLELGQRASNFQNIVVSQQLNAVRPERNSKMQTQPLINFSGLRREEENTNVTTREANTSSLQQKRRSVTHGQSVSVHLQNNQDINLMKNGDESQNNEQLAYMGAPTSPEKVFINHNSGQRSLAGNSQNAPNQFFTSLQTSVEGPLDPAAQRRRIAGLAIAAVAHQQNGTLNNQLSILTNLAHSKGKQLADIQQGSPNSVNNEKGTGQPITMKDMPVISGISLGYALNPAQSSITQNNSVEKLQKAKELQKVETSNHSKELQKVVREGIKNGEENVVGKQEYQQQQQPPVNTTVNSRITRKLEGGRPHKVYDYMFIQMSNEQFRTEYCGKKIIVLSENGQQVDPAPQYYRGYEEHHHQNFSPRKLVKVENKMASPYKVLDKNGKFLAATSSPNAGNQQFSPNLNGLVQIKAYDNVITDELPMVQCNLLPTQLDHVKVLICEQEDKNYPKLTIDAANRFEIEKQNQIKQYMEDIIGKLQQKDRKFKVTVKKKFVEDALYNSTSIRVASVYVIVINREKAYDPLLNQKQYRPPRRHIANQEQQESSEEEEDNANQEPSRLRKDSNNKGNPIWLNGALKKSHYDSDANPGDNFNSTSASSNLQQFKKYSHENRQRRQGPLTSAPNFKRQNKEQEMIVGYRYQPPIKEYKYGPTKIKIIQDTKVHDHHLKHHLNIYFNQYNEFIRLVFKQKPISNSQNAQPPPKMNIPYLVGLSKALGLNLKKDAFSEQNMKSREHLGQLKEKLIFCFYNKLNDSNKDLDPPAKSGESTGVSTQNDTEQDNIDESVDSEGKSSTNQRRSFSKEPNSALEKEVSLSINQQKDFSVAQLNNQVLPPANVIYKYFIGKGNNSIMVRSLFKNRYWWMQHDKEEMEKVNFCWTQNKKQIIMDVLSCKFPFKKSGIKNNQFNQKQILATPQNKKQKKKIQSQERTVQKLQSDINPVNNSGSMRTNETKLYNKIEDNFHMNNKKALYLNMKNYYDALDQDVFDNLPLTFHIKEGLDDPEFQRFKQYYDKFEDEIKAQKKKKKENRAEEDDSPKKDQQYYKSQAPLKNIWIVKPGENTNRGQGIQVARDFNEIRDIIMDSTANRRRTCIVQKYIHNPLLIHKRKFDIRTYALITSVNGNLKCYLYDEGYLRTSSREYSIQNLSNKLVHLTNDAVQKRSDEYGKFEPGNKLSYNEFQAFLDKTYPELNICFERDIQPQMNKMTVDIFRACHGKLDPKRRLNCMEVFGLDFMICDEFKPYLIEVNTNPCLELSSPLLARLIPNMLENALKIGLDTQFLPPEHFSSKKAFIGDHCPENRFTLCFDDKIDGPVLDKLFEKKNNIIIEMDEDELSEDEHDDEDEK